MEVDLERGVSVTPTKTPIPALIESFLRQRQAELQGLSNGSCRGDVSRLRLVFGPVSSSLILPEGSNASTRSRRQSKPQANDEKLICIEDDDWLRRPLIAVHSLPLMSLLRTLFLRSPVQDNPPPFPRSKPDHMLNK